MEDFFSKAAQGICMAVKYPTAICTFKTSSLGKEKHKKLTYIADQRKYFMVIFLDYI